MSSLDFDLDLQMNHLEFEWRRLYEDSSVARAEYQALAARPADNAELAIARGRLEQAEARKARILAKESEGVGNDRSMR